jgi:SpoIID/LytB domain protein
MVRKFFVFAGLLAMVALVLLPLGTGTALALQETYVFEGSGWGHGVGLCQEGARGMASRGFDYRQILTYYYQGTQESGWSCPAAIRVGLLEGQGVIYMIADSGSFILYTSDGDIPGGVMTPGGTWTVAADENARFFIVRPDGTCVNNTSYGGVSKPLYVRGASGGDVLRLPQNGNHRVSHLTNYVPLELNLYGSSRPYSLRAILISWFEAYLKGIAEIPGSWPQEAVKAQVVAARSYAVRSMGKHASSNYDVCDDVHCQYYKGYDQEGDTGWTQAVDATAGQVLTYGGQVAQCFYSDSCGGHTDNNEDVWPGSPVPYLRGVPDPYCMDDSNPHAHWMVTYSRGEMEARLNAHPGSYVGTLYSMDLSDRTPSGRVRTAAFTGSAGSKRISGELLRGYLDLPSAMVNTARDNFDEYILLANPSGEEAAAQVKMHTASGKEAQADVALPPMSRRTVHVDDYLYSEEVSAEVHSDKGIVAERSMYFDYRGEDDGGSCEHGASSANTEWYLAEGYTAQAFDTWILIYNPGGEPAHVTLDLLREDGYTGKFELDVAAGARATVNVDGLEGFSSCSLSARVSSDKPVVVERAMYFESWGRRGGHVSLGSPELSTSWSFAEGYTGGDFDTWFLVGNPLDDPAKVRFHLYVPGGGGEKTVEAEVAPHSRHTLHADDYLPDAEVSAFLESDRPVVAERSMYFDYHGKDDGSCSLGTPQLYSKWYLAEGYTGGDFDEYVLVGNPGDQPARVKFSFLTQQGFQKETFCDMAPRSRYTLHVDDYFPSDDVSLVVEETGGKGIVVERAMYFDYYGRKGGHVAMGVPQPSTTWYFAEGYTGS